MKILCLTPWFPFHKHEQNGNFILDSVEALTNFGHEVVIVVSQPWRPRIAGWLSRHWQAKTLDSHTFSEKLTVKVCRHFSIPRHYFQPVSIFAYRKTLARAMEMLANEHKYELIHAHTEIAGAAAVDVGQRLGIPTVVTLHGIDTDKKLYQGWTQKLLFEDTLKKADRVVLVGESLRPFFKKFVTSDDHFHVVHNGFRFNTQKNYLKNQNWPECLRFISVSNLHEGKGIDINLYALARLQENGIKNWTYKIVGDGSERRKLEQLVIHLNLQERVFFLGACQHDVVYQHLAEADIFSLPSYREAFGVAYIEAMSFGLLAIGIKGQGPEAFIEHGKTGLLVPPQNSELLAKAFMEIFASRHEMREIAQEAKKYVDEHFTWDHHAKSLTMVYQDLLKAKK